MDNDRRCLRLCAAVLVCSVLLRLGASGAFAPAVEWITDPATASFLLYLQTGRVVRASAPMPLPPPDGTVPPASERPRTPASFSESELEQITMYYRCSRRPELAPLLTQKLDWDLSGPEPKVLIVHTHTSESYTPETAGEYEPSGDYRTLDPRYNVLSVGDLVARELEAAGIGVVQDREFHDYPSFNHAYPNTAASTAQLLERYPTVELILDLHRDAADMHRPGSCRSCGRVPSP